MKTVFTTNFGKFPLRFTVRNRNVFVSKKDLTHIFYDFFPAKYRSFVDKVIDEMIPNVIGVKSDITSGAVGESEIGAVIHFHAVGNFITSWEEMIDVDDEVLRNAAFQISVFFKWYADASYQAQEYFGITLEDLLMSVKNRLDLINPPYIVEVSLDNESGESWWVGTCDELHLVTEGRTYEELQQRVWEVAPEMHELQGHGKETDNIRISFVQTESQAQHQLLEM